MYKSTFWSLGAHFFLKTKGKGIASKSPLFSLFCPGENVWVILFLLPLFHEQKLSNLLTFKRECFLNLDENPKQLFISYSHLLPLWFMNEAVKIPLLFTTHGQKSRRKDSFFFGPSYFFQAIQEHDPCSNAGSRPRVQLWTSGWMHLRPGHFRSTLRFRFQGRGNWAFILNKDLFHSNLTMGRKKMFKNALFSFKFSMHGSHQSQTVTENKTFSARPIISAVINMPVSEMA